MEIGPSLASWPKYPQLLLSIRPHPAVKRQMFIEQLAVTLGVESTRLFFLSSVGTLDNVSLHGYQ